MPVFRTGVAAGGNPPSDLAPHHRASAAPRSDTTPPGDLSNPAEVVRPAGMVIRVAWERSMAPLGTMSSVWDYDAEDAVMRAWFHAQLPRAAFTQHPLSGRIESMGKVQRMVFDTTGETDWAEETAEWQRAMRRPNPVVVKQIHDDFQVIGEEGATFFGKGGDYAFRDPKTGIMGVIPAAQFDHEYVIRGGGLVDEDAGE